MLAEAAGRAGLGGPVLLPEPVAAGMYHRGAGWLQAPTASVTRYMLQTEWRKYEPVDEVSTGTC
ncbi:hypothetical protein GCM10009557_67200 [Virgisporangium ochraceum]